MDTVQEPKQNLPPIIDMPTTENAVPPPPPTPIPAPAPAPAGGSTQAVAVKPKKKWGTGALVGAIGAILVLVIGVFAGTGVVTNLKERFTPKKATGGSCSGSWTCTCTTGYCASQGNLNQQISYQCSNWNGTNEGSCTGGSESQGNFCQTVNGWNKTSGGCAWTTEGEPTPTPTPNPGGDTSTGGSIQWDGNNCAVIPLTCAIGSFGRRFTCQGNYISQGRSCGETTGGVTDGKIYEPGETICVPPVSCGTTVQADIRCGSDESFRSLYGGDCAVTTPTPTPTPPGGTNKACGETCAVDGECNASIGLTCQDPGGGNPKICWGDTCNPATPTPTPTPPGGSAQCQQAVVQKIVRGGQEVPNPTKDDIRLGDVVTFRGTATQAVSVVQFNINEAGTSRTQDVPTGGQTYADLQLTISKAGNYTVTVGNITP